MEKTNKEAIEEYIGRTYYKCSDSTRKLIEKNNGWIRIEPDGINLPEEKTKVYVWYKKINQRCQLPKSYFKDVKSFDDHSDNIYSGHTPQSEFMKLYSHWRPIEDDPIW